MGMSHDRSHRVYESYRTRLGDLWATAKACGMSHAEILARRSEMQSEKRYQSMPSWRKMMLSEFDRCKLGETFSRDLTWTHVLFGVRMPSKEVPRQCISDIDTNESAHVWSNHPNKRF